jgi:Protein of unknown function (DUF3891)
MIIRPDESSLLFMTQHDHARLSADLLSHWTADGFADHPRREALLLAAREHDNGWREIDDGPAFDALSGAALDFMSVSDEIKRALWPRAIERVAKVSAYAAALIAQHAISVYDTRAEDPLWRSFFDDMAARRDGLLASTAHTPDELQGDYRFLSIVDLLSLSFCNGWADERERYGCRVRYAAEGIDVSPAPFANVVTLRIRARRLPDRRYASTADLRATLEDAPPEVVEGLARVGVGS